MNKSFRTGRIVAINVVIAVVLLFSSCSSNYSSYSKNVVTPTKKPAISVGNQSHPRNLATAKPSPIASATIKPTVKPAKERSLLGSNLKVYFLDVGQADSILITDNGETMLIDAGNNADGVGVVDYLKEKGITTIDYLIGTHPHEDHIGGLDDVINNFNVGKVIMPDVASGTKTYRDVISAEESKNLTNTFPQVGAVYTLKYAKFEVLSPSEIYSDTNENSVVVRLTYGKESFLFCGDADFTDEADMEAAGFPLKSDVIKIGHHGSATSSSAEFLQDVKPKFAVISVGAGNSYGHPTQTALNSIADVGAKVLRTDLLGTIIFTTDGKNLSVSDENTAIDGN